MRRLVSKITKIANPGKIGGKTALRKGEKGLSPGWKTGPGRRLRGPDKKENKQRSPGQLVYTTCFAAPEDRTKSILRGEKKKRRSCLLSSLSEGKEKPTGPMIKHAGKTRPQSSPKASIGGNAKCSIKI